MSAEGTYACMLESAIRSCTQDRLAVAHDEKKGRCLAAVKTIATGEVLRDDTLYLGSSRGSVLLRVCGDAAPQNIKDGRSLADMDLAAAIAEDIATNNVSASAAIASLLCKEEKYVSIEAPKSVYGLLPESFELPWEKLCELWRSIPLNWRCVKGFAEGAFATTQCGQACKPLLTLQSEVFSGLFLLNSMIEHSCKPNLGIYWHVGKLHFVALRDIAIGDHVTMSYLDVNDLSATVFDRQKILRDSWHFDCSCHRCVEEQGNVSHYENSATFAALESALRTWRNELRILASEATGVASSLARCHVALTSVIEIAHTFHGYYDQSVLQLLFFKALIGGNIDAQELHRVCLQTLGEKSMLTGYAQLLETDPNDFLAHVLSVCHADASSASYDATEVVEHFRKTAMTFGPQRVFGQLCHEGIAAMSGCLVLIKGRYVSEVLVQPIGDGVVERIGLPQSHSASQRNCGGGASRVSRFKQQQAQRNMNTAGT